MGELDPRLILTLGLALAGLYAAYLAGVFVERQRVQRRGGDTLEDLHAAILRMLDRACAAEGRWAKIHWAEKIETLFDARLAKSIALVEPFRKKIRAATGVFKPDAGKGHGGGHGQEPGHGHGKPAAEDTTHATASNGGVIVLMGAGAGAAHGGHDHGDHDHLSEADKHEQIARALRDLRAHWRRHGLDALEDARDELAQGAAEAAPARDRDAPLIRLA